jgi:hypothetical protein
MVTITLIHPGYLRREDHGIGVNVDHIKSMRRLVNHGSYDEYLENLRILHSQTSEDSIFFVERENPLEGKKDLHPYHAGFEPPVGSLVIEMSNRRSGLGIIKPTDHGWEENTRIQFHELADYLLGIGIDELALAGEMGPYSGDQNGCVGQIYKILSDKLTVKGIKGCIFPITPYGHYLSDYFIKFRGLTRKDKIIVEQARMKRDLYDEAFDLTEWF